MVIFQTPDGSPGYNQFETVDAAVAFVEQLRNDQGVSNARMFKLDEVKFDYKPYYRVELAALTSGAGPDAASAEAPVSPPPASPPPSAPIPDAGAGTETAGSPLQAVPSVADDDADLSSPVGSVPPAPAGEGDGQIRRGLFGR